jgi:iron complex outermembrane receptor protein
VVKSAFLCGGSVLAVAASLYGPQAFAATATDTATTPTSVAELVVVATKREEKIETVPVAITAYSAEQRKLMGIEIVQDLANFVPSLNWTDINDRIYIRGIGRNSDNLNNTSGVAIYYNGLYYGANASVELQKDDLFIANVEVDAGPQNTLHGSNSDGGVVNFVSARPTSTPYAEIRTGVANLDEEFVEAVVSGPINDNWKGRFGANFTEERGGNFNNLDGPPQGGGLVLGGAGNTEYWEAQLQGHYDHFDIWTMLSSGDFAGNSKGAAVVGSIPDNFFLNGAFSPNSFYGLCGLPGVPGTVNGAGCAGGPAIVPGSVKTAPITANLFPGNNPGNLDPRNFIQEFNTINNQQRNYQYSLDATWHAPGVDVQFLGSYQQFHYVLEFPSGTDAGVDSYQLIGAQSVGAAGTCLFAGFSLASCEAPLTISPYGSFTLFNEYDQSWSTELNFISSGSGPLQYIAGAYWWHEHWNQPVQAGVEPQQTQIANPDYILSGCGTLLCAAPPNASDAISSENTEINYNSYAGYGQLSYKLNDQWKVSGALRYTLDDKAGWQDWRFIIFDDAGILGNTFGQSVFGSNTPAVDITAGAAAAALGKAFPGAGVTTINAATGYAQRTLSQSTGAITGEADIDWTPDPSLLVYGKYSRGYKSGGWSTYTIIANPETLPEYVDAFEGGVKKSTGQYTINADIFYYNYYNEQVPESLQTSTGQIVPTLGNIPLVHDYGFELSSSWRPTDALSFNLTYSYLSAKVSNGGACLEDTVDPQAVLPGASIPLGAGGCYANAAGLAAARAAGAVAQSVKGETIPAATPNKVAFNTLYTLSFDPGKLTLSGTLIWKDATYYDIFNRPYALAPSYTTVNLRATWTAANGRYNVIAFMNNVFNSLGYDGAGGVQEGTPAVGGTGDILSTPTLVAPREFGLQFQYRWK